MIFWFTEKKLDEFPMFYVLIANNNCTCIHVYINPSFMYKCIYVSVLVCVSSCALVYMCVMYIFIVIWKYIYIYAKTVGFPGFS